MLTIKEFDSVNALLIDIDREITEVHDAGFPTSPLTDALDHLWDYVRQITEKENSGA